MEWWHIPIVIVALYLALAWVVGGVAFARTKRTIRAEAKHLGYRPRFRDLALMGVAMLTPVMLARMIAHDVAEAWRRATSKRTEEGEQP